MSSSRKRTSARNATRISEPGHSNHRDDDQDYDSDEGPPPSSVTQLVSTWRLNPEESFSDWTIDIIVNGVKRDTYHVHKNNLAVGPRKSEYFAKLFAQGGRFSEARDRTSRIELEALAADAFPQLLDYMYFPERSLVINTMIATALYSMAKYFDMRCLRWEAKQFWQADIKSKQSCAVYYEHARLLNDDKILKAAAESCAQQIMSIPKTSRLVHVPDPKFWLQILEKKENASDEFICHISILLAEFAQNNVDILDSVMFRKLTDRKLLRIVSVESALPLIDAERQIVEACVKEKLSDLQERCIAALSKGWTLIDTECQGIAMKLIKKQNPFVLSKILEATLSAAQAVTKQQEQRISADQAVIQRQKRTISADQAVIQQQEQKISAAKAVSKQHEEELRGFQRLHTNSYCFTNGKIDRNSLPATVVANAAARGEAVDSGSNVRVYLSQTQFEVPLFYFKKL